MGINKYGGIYDVEKLWSENISLRKNLYKGYKWTPFCKMRLRRYCGYKYYGVASNDETPRVELEVTK